MAPAGTPKAVIDKVYRDTVKALQSAGHPQALRASIGMVPVGNPPDEFAKAIREETERWAKVVKERKLQVAMTVTSDE